MKRISELFKCPQCFNHRLQEVRINVTVTTAVEMLGGAGDVQYGEQTREDGTMERFQCIDCGWAVPDATTAGELYDLLTCPESPCRP